METVPIDGNTPPIVSKKSWAELTADDSDAEVITRSTASSAVSDSEDANCKGYFHVSGVHSDPNGGLPCPVWKNAWPEHTIDNCDGDASTLSAMSDPDQKFVLCGSEAAGYGQVQLIPVVLMSQDGMCQMPWPTEASPANSQMSSFSPHAMWPMQMDAASFPCSAGYSACNSYDRSQSQEAGAESLTPSDEWTHTFKVMMRNLPNKYSQAMLIEDINEAGFCGCFDFVDLPLDQVTKLNKGYAFISFLDPAYAWSFRCYFEGRRMRRFNSEKHVRVVPAYPKGKGKFHRQRSENDGAVNARPGKGNHMEKEESHCEAKAEVVEKEQGTERNFCPYCGGKVKQDYKFCPYCSEPFPQ